MFSICFLCSQTLPSKTDQTAVVKEKSLKKEENILEQRARSETWGSQSPNKEKDVLLQKTSVRREKEVRRSGDDRRQKRGKFAKHVGDTIVGTTLTA